MISLYRKHKKNINNDGHYSVPFDILVAGEVHANFDLGRAEARSGKNEHKYLLYAIHKTACQSKKYSLYLIH